MNISLRQLEVFALVAENRSFSKAAEELFLSQSTVSSHVAQLETLLGASLLRRENKKQVEPTEAGWRVYREAKEILNLCRSLEDTFQPAQDDPPIAIAASTVPSRHLLPRMLSAYVQEHPASRFSILKGDSAYALEKLRTGEATLAFVGTKIRDNRFCYTAISRDRIVLIAPNTPEFLEKQRKNMLGKDLLHHPMILREAGSGTRKEADKYLEKIGVKAGDLSVVAYMNDLEMVKQSVQNGLGITIISERVAEEDVKAGKILQFNLDESAFYRNIYLVYGKNRRLSAGERAFVSFAQRYGKQD